MNLARFARLHSLLLATGRAPTECAAVAAGLVCRGEWLGLSRAGWAAHASAEAELDDERAPALRRLAAALLAMEQAS